MYPLELYSGPTILATRPCQPYAGFGLMLMVMVMMVNLSQSDLLELVMMGGKSEPQNVPISVE